jgi:hypothetical protein
VPSTLDEFFHHGIIGDPSVPLSNNPNDPYIIDPDGDGNPGVTVEIHIGNIINGEIYILRREIYSDHLTLNADGILYRHVEDKSEQFVIRAWCKITDRKSDRLRDSEREPKTVFLMDLAYMRVRTGVRLSPSLCIRCLRRLTRSFSRS